MKTRPVLISLLIAAHVSVAMAVVAEIGSPTVFGVWLPVTVVSTAQVGLLSIWTALGRRATAWRPTILIAAIVGWSWIDAKIGLPAHIMVVVLPVAVATVTVLCVARLLGLRVFLDREDQTENHVPWQFSLRQMFAWTTSLAISLGLLIETFRHLQFAYPVIRPGEFVLTIVLITGAIFISIMLAWFQSRRHNIVLLSIFTLLLVILYLICCSTPRMYFPLGVFFILVTLIDAASLLVLRVAGYRITRP